MSKRGYNQRGFTLVEILVVIGIISILAGISVAGVARMGAGSKQDLGRTTRHLHSLLRAAKVYADTFNVKTAVVYNMDNYLDPLPPGAPANPFENKITKPVVDAVTGRHVRVITSAAVLYELPRASGPFQGVYVPAPGEKGEFRLFEGEQVLMLNDPTNITLLYYYISNLARYDKTTEVFPYIGNNIQNLGMTSVEVFVRQSGPFAIEGTFDWKFPTKAWFPAHVFEPGGRLLITGDSSRERYTLFIGPPPDGSEDELLLNPEDRKSGRVYRGIHIYRSTGRVKIAG